MNRIYTRTGDDGTTLLVNGKRVKKTSELIEFYGTLDELNSFLGFAAESICEQREFVMPLKSLYRIQKELFSLSNTVISGEKLNLGLPLVNKLEEEIDYFQKELPILKSFILPGAGEGSARLHLARSVCRRAERAAFRVVPSIKNLEIVAIYLNRLSDWLFVLARYVAFVLNIEEHTV